ncbi:MULTISPECIES: SAM-dependent methyltransferase [unclassified Rhizobium]|uniref:SAM-dependent methyltransferase n=1 Tax=unclassified Rhizobium TaxID=2613769 RepID=UPI001ADAE9C7|nr:MULTISPECIES: cyclopropane-fatty-acyl-phospholipid synthase family protein [unclassified Rhizobium]MBO9097463.1 class I SAM-dependent methyltransferase [Rhizobium sp. L58/93]MBO9133685.1 class I SAM-dependent methyltransferase [Rhizobium sp. B209b/85]MBO9167702.1 class I SAM-dependent methyltransferase [Rhizobium sp. L245/93]MBO9183661.1 class I SAM-dependent methyltransferase [Rhizobium sp. E27B/91]QXZ83979.1 class I SAM-dependent methyltransferase [Rhizobium sp. K1/93]
MASSLLALVTKIIRKGSLQITLSNGETHLLGDGTGQTVAVRTADREAEDAIATDPTLKLGEMFMEGRFILEQGDIYDFLSLVKLNTTDELFDLKIAMKLIGRIAWQQLKSRLPVNRSKHNVAHHYDLSAKLFDLFLDEDWQYSCAYFEPPGIGLDEAQLAKKRHIAAKLRLEPGQSVLEIGSGWGGMGMYLAESTENVDFTGITLSEEQLKVSRARAAKRGLSDRVRFELQDYRYLSGRKFDRIVSVGMFEHVGIGNYRKFFSKVSELLADDGVMVLHSIGRPRPSFSTNAFIERYIFPGGYIPSLAETTPALEKANLLVKDIEILPMHYAYTLRHWRERFIARKEEAVALYDEKFFRMWEFYLAGSEMAFRWEQLFIFQIQIAKDQFAVPDNRNYIAENEARLKEFEARRAPLEKVVF